MVTSPNQFDFKKAVVTHAYILPGKLSSITYKCTRKLVRFVSPALNGAPLCHIFMS